MTTTLLVQDLARLHPENTHIEIMIKRLRTDATAGCYHDFIELPNRSVVFPKMKLVSDIQSIISLCTDHAIINSLNAIIEATQDGKYDD